MFGEAGSVTLTGGEVGVRGITGAPVGAVRAASEIWLGADPLDLTANYLPKVALVSPADQVWPEVPDATREWVAPYKNAWWYADPEIADMTRGLLTRADGAAFAITVDTARVTRELWLRHFVSPEGSALEVSLNGQAVARIQTREAAGYGYRWTRIEAPTSGGGAHTVQVRTDGLGLNAVSQLGLLTSVEIEAAELAAAHALRQLPAYTVLPDLGTTDGNRTFALARTGVYTVRLATRPGFDPALAIDGAPVTLARARTEAGYDILEGVVGLEAGLHRLTLRAPPPPEPVVSVTHQPQAADAFQPCDSARCEGPVLVEATVPSDGRTVAFLGRVTAGADDAYAIGAQAHPNITHVSHREEARERDRPVRVEVPLDAGSSIATLEVRHRHEQLPGLEFELLAVARYRRSRMACPLCLAHEQQPTPLEADGALALIGDERGWASGEYTGKAGEAVGAAGRALRPALGAARQWRGSERGAPRGA